MEHPEDRFSRDKSHLRSFMECLCFGKGRLESSLVYLSPGGTFAKGWKRKEYEKISLI